MKDKSSTKKQYFEAERVFVHYGTKYLINWTQKELVRYREEPVVIPNGNYGFLVGKFKVTGLNKHSWKVEQLDGKHINTFTSKQNALLFCLLEVSKKYSAANELLLLDIKLGNLENDMYNYKHIISDSKDKFKSNTVLHRLLDAKSQFRTYTMFLKKTLNSAKYMNFGNYTL